jgi:hypothetical protein
MAHLLRLLILLFLAVHVSPLPLTTYDESMCSKTFRCGGVDIAYPFYLSNATQATPDYASNYSCGYTDLKIFCQGEGKAMAPILELDGKSYTILHIFYHNSTIILADTEVLGGNACPRVSHDVSFGRDWLNYTDSFDSLRFFYDCYPASESEDDQPPHDLETYKITCRGFNSNRPPGSGDGVSFVFTSDSEERKLYQEYKLADHCNENFVVPVHEDVLQGSGQLVLPMAYGAVLKRGFELGWNQSTAQPWCHLCEQSGGRCSYSEKKEFLGCLCSGGKVEAQDCNGSGATTAYADPSSSKFLRTDRSILIPSENKHYLYHATPGNYLVL